MHAPSSHRSRKTYARAGITIGQLNRVIGKVEVQGVTETADCESRGCSSWRVDEYPDVVHAILLRRPECALLDERVYDDVDFSYLAVVLFCSSANSQLKEC